MNKYIVGAKLGEGTFGRCYQVTHQKTGLEYAAKVIKRVDRYIISAKDEVLMISKIHSTKLNDPILQKQIDTHIV